MTGGVEQMSLDHDIDDPDCDKCQFVCGHIEGQGCQGRCRCHSDNGSMTGMQLLRWMHALGLWPKQKPEVHTANNEARPRMVSFINEHFRPAP